MFDHTPPKCRAKWTSRAVTALCFALAVAVGTTHAPTDAFADEFSGVADDAPADPEVVRNLEADLAVLSERVSADLDARVKAKTDAIVQQAAEQQIAALLHRSQQNLAMRREVSNRVDHRMATMTVWADRPESVGDSQDRPVKIASGSLEIGQQALAEGVNERVERGRHRFEAPFVGAPKVALGMRLDDLTRPDRRRVAIRVVHVDEEGFDYEIRTSGSSSVRSLTADWVAYASESPPAPPASVR